MIKAPRGFTLIELVVFIIVTALLASTILLTMTTSLENFPSSHNNFIANELATRCIEGYMGIRRLSGYTDTDLACSASLTLPAICSTLTGYTVSGSITCSPTLAGDSTNSKTLTITVSGLGDATLTQLFADY